MNEDVVVNIGASTDTSSRGHASIPERLHNYIYICSLLFTDIHATLEVYRHILTLEHQEESEVQVKFDNREVT